jgi:hypothetical protein
MRAQDPQLRESIEDVCTWLSARGYSIDFERNGEDAVFLESKLLSVRSSRSLRGQLYTLLHECGHILIHESDTLVNSEEEVLEVYSSRSKIHKTFTVIEEIEAWKRGLSLAGRLGIEINKVKWNKDVAKSIMAYMKWAVG